MAIIVLSLCWFTPSPAATPGCPAMGIVQAFLRIKEPTDADKQAAAGKLWTQRNRLSEEAISLITESKNEFLKDVLAECREATKVSTPPARARKAPDSPEGVRAGTATAGDDATHAAYRASAIRKLFPTPST